MQFSIPTHHRPAAILLAGLGVLYAIPLLLTDRPYIDDIGRRMHGYLGWSDVGRPLADLVMVVLNLGVPISDLAPLPQMLGVAIVALCSYLLFRWTEGMNLPPLFRAIASAFFLFNPFLLSNLSYRFDSLSMALSMLAALWALNPGVARPRRAFLASVGLVYAAMTLYQASLNVVVAASVLLLVADVDAGRAATALRTFGRRIATTIAAYAIYWVTISSWVPFSDYAAPHSKAVPLSLEGLRLLASNTIRGLSVVVLSFDRLQESLLAAPVATASVFCTVLAVRTARIPDLRQKWLLCILVAASPLLMLLLAFGVSSALRSPVYAPRVFLGFGCTYAFFILFALRGLTGLVGRKRRRLGLTLLLVAPATIAVTTPFAFSSAQVSQRIYDQRLVTRIEAGLIAIHAGPSPRFAIAGTQPFAPATAHQIVRYPIMRALVPRYMWDWVWSMYYLNDASIEVRLLKQTVQRGYAKKAHALPPDYVGNEFTLTRVDNVIVLSFAKGA